MRSTFPAILILCLAPCVQAADSPATAEHLRCEYRVDPLGIDVTEPRLSWEMHDPRRGAKQTAYQVLVAGSPEKLAAHEGDLWDSGKVPGDQSTQIVYAGKPLLSHMHCHWKVRLWDAEGHPTPYSKPALWSMGLLQPADVKAKWIGLDGPMTYPGTPADAPPITFDGCAWVWAAEPGVKPRENAPPGTRFFRGRVTIPQGKVIRQAIFVISADDRCELFVNKKSAGVCANWNLPQAIDITQHLVAGKNCLTVAASNAIASPAGLAGKLVVHFQEGEPLVHRIDASWRAGLKSEPDWNAVEFDDSRWPAAVEIARMGDAPWGMLQSPAKTYPYACPLFRKEFRVEGAVRRATVYGSALGIYRLHINGKPVGNDYFTPDWTDYRKRVYYNTYDVTDLIRSNGPNAIGGVLASGWFAGAVGWEFWDRGRLHYGDKPRLFAQLTLEMADGSIQTIATDGSWKTAHGPYVEGDLLAGETYDATREISGWASPGLDDAAWRPVAVTESIPAKLQAFPGVTVQETGVVRPVKITEPKPGVHVFDLGQNFAGFARLKVRGPAGTRVVLRFAEVLKPDGMIFTENLREARATDSYVLNGQGEEVWQPRFTFHGFRYVEVSGFPGKPSADAITGIAVNSNVPLVGTFECSSPMVNRLYQNIVWTQRANFISVPTDCPQRNERLGWTGDAQAFVRAATYNADVAAFFTKWLVDLEDAQGPGGDFPNVAPRVLAGSGVAAWADAGTICPWTIYQVYNDRRLLEKHYAAMVRWVEYCRRNSKDLLRPAAGFGDWLSIGANTPLDVIATAYFAHSAHLTAEAAHSLGRSDDARKYEELSRQVKRAFNRAYVGPDGRIKGNTQTCYLIALWFDLLPADKQAAAARHLADDIKQHQTHLTTGFVGTSVLMPTLSATGNNGLAYRLLLNDTFPSWGFAIKHDATSIWERWDGWTPQKGFQDPGMNSFAHYAFGAVAQWMFQTVAGIDMAAPGFQRLLIRPQPAEGLSWARASYRSPHGLIATEWRKAAGRLDLAVTIPANTTATIYLPAGDSAATTQGPSADYQGEGVRFLRREGGQMLYEVGAGQYGFSVQSGGR
jgi:alpha-L-rhamnosidase